MAKGPRKAGAGTRGSKKTNPETAPLDEGRNELTDDEKQALFLHNLTKLERLIVARDAAASAVRNFRKTMKADGFEPAEIDYALCLRKKPEAEAVQDAAQRARVARWLAHPLGHQSELFDEETGEMVDRTPGTEKAVAEGRADGLEGKPASVRYAVNSPQGQAYLEAWQTAQAEIAARFGTIDGGAPN